MRKLCALDVEEMVIMLICVLKRKIKNKDKINFKLTKNIQAKNKIKIKKMMAKGNKHKVIQRIH